MITTRSIEDCIELLVGLQSDPNVIAECKPEDYKILTSIGRQVFKGIGLTDRQYVLVKTKLIEYSDMFNYNLEESFNTLRIPLRELNREKTINLVTNDDQELLIAIQFIFNKRLLASIEKTKNESTDHNYDSVNKIHYFPLTEKNVFSIINNFKNNKFIIQDELLTYFKKVEKMNNEKDKYIPGIYSFKLKNLTNKAIDFMVSSIGEPTVENLAIYNDRKTQLGLHYFDQEALEKSLNELTPLSKKIVTRSFKEVLISSTVWTVEQVLESILELTRYPILVLLPSDDPLPKLIEINNGLTNIFFSEDMSVLFRAENEDNGHKFNKYIKDNKLNNSVDKNTKVVYISCNKFPKPLINADWTPSVTLSIGSYRMNTNVREYINPTDLIIHYDTDVTPFNRVKVEKL
jgi:hypothetical protein